MDPLIVFAGKRIRDVGLEGFPEAIYGHSASGWMDSELFATFLEHFLQFVKSNNIHLPVMLFIDGHCTHLTLEAARFCSENKIVLYCLVAHATHLMQPCDVSLFSPLKSSWKAVVKQWHLDHLGEVFTKKHFPAVFKKAWKQTVTPTLAINGFRRSGLFPLTRNGIDETKLAPSS